MDPAELAERYKLSVVDGQAVVGEVPEVSLNQPAYHGSPYRFDKFTLDKIGSGEGAQAYGWGLYFAGNKQVAEYYRGALAGEERIYTLKGQPIDIDSLGTMDKLALQIAARPDLYSIKSVEEAGASEESLRELRSLVKKYKGAKYEEAPKGQLYEVNIPEDDTMLHWDKPLSEQPEKVKDALANVKGIRFFDSEGNQVEPSKAEYAKTFDENNISTSNAINTGEQLYHAMHAEHMNQEAASRYLHSLGIDGIKYLDGNSRFDGVGSYNYVVFDDQAINVLKTYYQSAGVAPEAEAPPPNSHAGNAIRKLSEAGATDAKVAMPADTNPTLPEPHQVLHNGKTLLQFNFPGIVDKDGHSLTLNAFADQVDSRAKINKFLEPYRELMAKLERKEELSDVQLRLFQQLQDNQNEGQPRGALHIGNKSMTLQVFKSADKSTVAHELGHFYLEVMRDLAAQEGTAEQIKQDYQTVLQHYGTDDGSGNKVLTREAHERFADAHLLYLAENKAPSEELRPVFQRFSRWLARIWEQVKAGMVDVQLNDEVRAVFDRLYASDAEIEAARNDLGRMAVTAEEAKMTDAEFQAYSEMAEKRIAEA
jgi:hypothetical protein